MLIKCVSRLPLCPVTEVLVPCTHTHNTFSRAHTHTTVDITLMAPLELLASPMISGLEGGQNQ